MPHPTRGRPAMTKPVRTAMAACREHGLSYWCRSVEPGCVWAVNATTQKYVLVRVREMADGRVLTALATKPLPDGGHQMLARKELTWLTAAALPADAPIPEVI